MPPTCSNFENYSKKNVNVKNWIQLGSRRNPRHLPHMMHFNIVITVKVLVLSTPTWLVCIHLCRFALGLRLLQQSGGIGMIKVYQHQLMKSHVSYMNSRPNKNGGAKSSNIIFPWFSDGKWNEKIIHNFTMLGYRGAPGKSGRSSFWASSFSTNRGLSVYIVIFFSGDGKKTLTGLGK